MPVRKGISKWARAMRQAARKAEESARTWAEQYEKARPKMVENFRLDPEGYREGLSLAGLPTVRPSRVEAYRMSEGVAKQALAEAVGSGEPQVLTPLQEEQIRQENKPKVDCFCNLLANTEEDRKFCNEVLAQYVFLEIEGDEMKRRLIEHFGDDTYRQTQVLAKQQCPP